MNRRLTGINMPMTILFIEIVDWLWTVLRGFAHICLQIQVLRHYYLTRKLLKAPVCAFSNFLLQGNPCQYCGGMKMC